MKSNWKCVAVFSFSFFFGGGEVGRKRRGCGSKTWSDVC